VTVNAPCSVCAHADEHSWFGLEPGWTHCRGCHLNWKGTRQAHCVTCHRQFSSDTACELHKVYKTGRVCQHPDLVTHRFALGDPRNGVFRALEWQDDRWCVLPVPTDEMAV
jgi:hypothetical protein